MLVGECREGCTPNELRLRESQAAWPDGGRLGTSLVGSLVPSYVLRITSPVPFAFLPTLTPFLTY